MSLVSSAPSSSPTLSLRPQSAGRWCRECGYALLGLPAGNACPECGHAAAAVRISPGVAWCRSVFIGLTLLLVVTLYACSSVLMQPFNEQLGGTAPALNLPAPKLWAVPLLTRPTGTEPRTPGVVGTRVAMLSLLGVWLVTAPCTLLTTRRSQSLRLATRWISVALFGLAFGTMMACHNLWYELPPLRFLLVAGVELPTTLLLYMYLRRLSLSLPGRERRDAFDRVVWLAPLVVFFAVIILGLQWWQAATRDRAISTTAATIMGGTAVYGCFAMLCGVTATVAVSSLAGALFPMAFPRALRVLLVARSLGRRCRDALPALASPSAQPVFVAAGLLLLVVVAVAGCDNVLWLKLRQGVGGNLPFVNFPGPKLWASAAMTHEFRPGWTSLINTMYLIAANLLAFWLIASPRASEARDRLRFAVRWLPALAIGAGLAALLSLRSNSPWPLSPMKVYALVAVGLELPATLLLYLLMARIANASGRRLLGAQFRMICFLIVTLVATSLLMCALSDRFHWHKLTALVLAISAAYGALAVGSAVWATAAVLRLAGGLILDACKKEPPMKGRLAMLLNQS